MKVYIGVIAFLFAIIGCGQKNNGEVVNTTSPVEATSVAALTDTLCYERYSGSRNQDTASITLVINGNLVTGRYANIPYEKDARIGIINGTRSGDVIKGIWRFQQEGVNDSLAFAFKLDADNLLQKPNNFDVNTGRETIADTASFSLKYTKLDCAAVNFRIR